jgi:hypothetical protein
MPAAAPRNRPHVQQKANSAAFSIPHAAHTLERRIEPSVEAN